MVKVSNKVYTYHYMATPTQKTPLSIANPASNHTPLIFIAVIVLVGAIGLVAYIAINTERASAKKQTTSPTSAISKRGSTTPSSSSGSTPTTIDSLLAPSVGPDAAHAKVTVVEFLDFQCPYCQVSAGIVVQLFEKYQGQPVRFVFRNLPLETLHPYATPAAHAGLCANEQKKFIPFYSIAYSRQSEITPDNLYLFARDAGLNMNSFSSCMSKGIYYSQIQKDVSDAINLGAQGTPTWFINGQRFEGALTFEVLSTIINQ